MADQAEKLLKLKSDLQKTKEEQIALKSRLDTLMEQLKKDFGCASLDEANAMLEDISKQLEQLQTGLNERVEKFEEDYPL